MKKDLSFPNSRMSRILLLIKNIGFFETIMFYWARLQKWENNFYLYSKSSRFPLICRRGTSDLAVFHQIFVSKEYTCLGNASLAGLIIDCGANVGYSSAYFLSRFPHCQVVAIEPDPGNFVILQKNLESYKNRVRMVNSGVWSHPTALTIVEEKYRDGKEWTRQVREARPGEKALFLAVDIASILKESGQERISILKMDIEGAEGLIFSSGSYKAWIDYVDTILIELHDDSSFGKCSDIFFNAVAEDDFEFSKYGELTVGKRKKTGPRVL